MTDEISRRKMLGAAAAQLAIPITARSYSRILGANDRIQIGQIGSGHRSTGTGTCSGSRPKTIPNFDYRSVCDLWTVNRERGADHAKRCSAPVRKHTSIPKSCWRTSELDAVMIGTGDHQHARILAEVVRAGKDCYCEKPMANTLEDAKLARDTVQKQQADRADGFAVAERSLPAAGARNGAIRKDRQSCFHRPVLELQRSALAYSERSQRRRHPRAGYRLEPLAPGPCPAALQSPPVFRIPYLQRFFRRHYGPVVQPRLRPGAFLSGYFHPGRYCCQRRHFRLA